MTAKFEPSCGVDGFVVVGIEFAANSASTTITAGQTANIDYKLTEKRWTDGGSIYAEGAVVGDWMVAQVIHSDGTTVVRTWIERWYIAPDHIMYLKVPVAGQIPKNFTMRIVYHSTGGTDVKVFVNYRLSRKT